MKKGKYFLIGLAIIIGYFTFKSTPIDPVAFTPDMPRPMEGVLAQNNRLAAAEILAEGKLDGPEGLAIDTHGIIYAGTAEGNITKIYPYGFVLTIDEKGNILQSFHEPTGSHLKEITSALEHNGYLYLGSLHNDRIGKYKLKE